MSAPDVLSVLITGAAGPAGRATARRLAADGARIALNGRDPEGLAAAVAELGLPADRGLALPGDLVDPAEAQRVVGAVEGAFGRVDVVAHLVGGWEAGTDVAGLDHDEVRRMLDQHLWTTLNVLQAVLPGMRERGFGRLVAISSPLAANPGPRGASYAIAKSAAEILLRSVAREAAADGVTANVLVMRTLDDERSRAQRPNADRSTWTTPEEVADRIAWLVSPAAAATNGERISIVGQA